jgi:DnaK suppressor protein
MFALIFSGLGVSSSSSRAAPNRIPAPEQIGGGPSSDDRPGCTATRNRHRTTAIEIVQRASFLQLAITAAGASPPNCERKEVRVMSHDTATTRAHLEARLKDLQRRLTEMNETLREPEDDDLSEQALELDDDEVLKRLSLAGRDEALLIQAALTRIHKGTYSKCLSCGKEIAQDRLRALPEASTCLRCARSAGE